jgi:uncharacterized surface protein with fasciclin (FAS1) repeats
MTPNLRAALIAATLALAAAPAFAGDPMVGGAAMYPTRNIVQNAVNSKVSTTLVAAVKAAGLVSTLEGPGPFTVFAPTNHAFDALPSGTVPTLLKPENKAALVKVLTYHVVPGSLTTADLRHMVREGGGRATLTTVEGGILTVTDTRSAVMLTDAKGGVARITTANVTQSNGMIQVINKVLLPG